jgi:hypothetical protein
MDLEGSGSDPIEKISQSFSTALRENTKNLSEDSLCSGTDLNQGLPELES